MVLIERTLLRLYSIFNDNLFFVNKYHLDISYHTGMTSYMLPHLILSSVLVLCNFKIGYGSTNVVQSPIDVVRTSTTGNFSFECSKTQYNSTIIPLVFWKKASLETKLSLIQSLDKQDLNIKHGK